MELKPMTDEPVTPATTPPQPVRWRLALLVWLVAFVTALVVFIVGGQELGRLNVVLRALVVTGILVAVIQYVGLPLIFRFCRSVLFPREAARGGTTEETRRLA